MSYYDWAVGLSNGQAAARRYANAEVSQANDVTNQWIHYARKLEARVESLEAEKQSLEADRQSIERRMAIYTGEAKEHVEYLHGRMHMRDELIAQRDEQIAQRDEQIAQRDEQIAQRDEQYAWLKGYIDDLRDGIVTLD